MMELEAGPRNRADPVDRTELGTSWDEGKREAALRRELELAVGTVDAAAAEIALMSERLSKAVARADGSEALGRERADTLDALRQENAELRRLVEIYKAKCERAFEAWRIRTVELSRIKSC